MAHERGLIEGPDGAWSVRVQLGGERHQYGSFPTKTAARMFRDKKKAEYKLGLFLPEQHQRISLSKVIERYFSVRVNKKNIRNEYAYSTWWNERLGVKHVNAITALDIERARSDLLRSGRLHRRTPSTVNRYTDWLKHVMNIEVRQGRLAKNPVLVLDKFKEPPAPSVHVDEEMEERIVQALGEYADWVRLAILLGLREHEQFSLRWDCLDLDAGIGMLRDTKSGTPQPFMISIEAIQIFRKMPSYGTSPFVFPNPRHPARPINGRNWYKFFKRRLQVANIKVGRPHGVVWHTLRHTFGSRLAMSGASDRDIMELARWSSANTVKRYVHLRPSHLNEVINRLSSFGNGRKTAERETSPNGT
jgi:integrase